MSLCKPIQPTPALSGKDAENIIAQARIVPSKSAVEKNKRLLEYVKKIEK